MRIAQIATSSGPVREDRTGSIESLVWLLSRALMRMGHEVTVFACAGSEVPCELIEVNPGPYGQHGTPLDWQIADWITIAEAIAHSDRFDIIHSHAYLWALPIERFSRARMVHTMHIMPYANEFALWDRFPDAIVVGISEYQWAAAPRRPAAIIPHGLDPAHFEFCPTPQDYVCYLGRFIANKGPLQAILAAREAGIPIVLAGPANDYFEREIRPLIDGSQTRYIGEVNRQQRSALLGNARALLYPLQEPEPFGLVQVEAMMCGTPVIGHPIGAVPEIVEHGLTGILATDTEGLAAAVPAARALDRAAVRQCALQWFSAPQMARAHERLYQSALDA